MESEPLVHSAPQTLENSSNTGRTALEKSEADATPPPQTSEKISSTDKTPLQTTKEETTFQAPTQVDLWNTKELKTCVVWINQNLDLHGLTWREFHVDLIRADDHLPFVQFAHKRFMAHHISEHGIEAIDGGFPYYFTITLNKDGDKVVDHYASRE